MNPHVEVSGIYEGNFLPLYLVARQAAYTGNNITNTWKGAGIIPLNPRTILSKPESFIKNLSQSPAANSSQSPGKHLSQSQSSILATPRDSRAVGHFVR